MLIAAGAVCVDEPARFDPHCRVRDPLWRPRLRRNAASMKNEPFDIVYQIGEADLRVRPRQADGADEQVHPVLLFGKDVLDARTDPGLGMLARRVAAAIGRFAGFLRWTRETKPLFAMNTSFAADRYAVSAQTPPAVLVLSSRPSRSRRPSWAAAS